MAAPFLALASGTHAQGTEALPPAPALIVPSDDTEARRRAQALQIANAAVVGLRARVVDGATSAASLGSLRTGSGVVIDDSGLVLTIGYLILEAEQVDLLLDRTRSVPARVVAYDLSTGLGLVQSLVPLNVTPARFGSALTQPSDEPLMIASAGLGGGVSLARLVSRRPFSGYWEYHIDSALFTVPPRSDHSGAALFNAEGELLGIGSLVVTDVLGPKRPALPGNMFVPVDLIRPILDELRARGSVQAGRRAWLGASFIEQEGGVYVVRVTADSPAQAAGLRPGDRVLRIDGAPVSSLEAFYKTLWSGGAPERYVRLELYRGNVSETVDVRATDRMRTFHRALLI